MRGGCDRLSNSLHESPAQALVALHRYSPVVGTVSTGAGRRNEACEGVELLGVGKPVNITNFIADHHAEELADFGDTAEPSHGRVVLRYVFNQLLGSGYHLPDRG